MSEATPQPVQGPAAADLDATLAAVLDGQPPCPVHALLTSWPTEAATWLLEHLPTVAEQSLAVVLSRHASPSIPGDAVRAHRDGFCNGGV